MHCFIKIHLPPENGESRGFRFHPHGRRNRAGKRINMRFGLPDRLILEIVALARTHGLDRVVLFGSRARGDFRDLSDIDLAVSGGNVAAFAIDVEENTQTLLSFDIVDLDGAVQPELMESIEREGQTIYEKV